MPQACKSEAKSTTVLGLLLLLTFILVIECCPSGCCGEDEKYLFIGLSAHKIDHCSPFLNPGVKLLCEVKPISDTARRILDIQWYFSNSSSGALMKLANETSNYLIFNSYHDKLLKSVLILKNLMDGTDNGTYMCEGIVEPNNTLLPQPTFSIPPESRVIKEPCGLPPDRAVARSQCASVVSSLEPSVSIQVTSTALSMSLQTTGTKSTDSLSSIITSTFIGSVISASITIDNTVLPPMATDSVNNIASTTTSKTLIKSLSPASKTAVNIANSASTTSSNSITGNTVIHSSIIASNTLSSNGNTAVHSQSSSSNTVSVITFSAGNADQYPIAIWMYIIVIILSTSVLIFVTLALAVMIYFICRRSPSSPTIEDVVLRPRSRNPSDPLPPIRDSMILTSSDTTKSSNLSFPLTTIHCSPLQNQSMPNQSLQDVTFNLQGPSHSSFTVYAEVESLESNDVEETTTATTVSGFPNATGTYSSSHAYTLPDDTLYHSDDNTSSTGCWSPVVIREERQKQSDSTQNGPSSLLMCTQPQISSNSSDNITLSDEDRTSGSEDYYHGNLIVCHQSGPSSAQIRQTCSLTEQSFSLGGSATCHNRIVPAVGEPHVHVDYDIPSDFVLPVNERIDEGRARKPRDSSTESLTTSLQILFCENERDGRDSSTDDSNARSSSSSSGCTDLSKYSGDYERDPNYMRALLVRRGVEEEVPHQRSDLSPTQDRQENLDSGMDGLFYLPLLPDNVEEQSLTYSSSSSSDTYKSLESLTRNPSPVYMRPFLRETQETQEHSGFMSVTV